MVPVWSAACTRLFEHWILCLTASTGFPLFWVENPEFQAIWEEFIPGSPHISWKVLTKRILWEVVTEFHEGVKRHVARKEATMQSNGWTGINNHHLVAFMITTNKLKVIVLQFVLYMPVWMILYHYRFVLLMFMTPRSVKKWRRTILWKLKMSMPSSKRNDMFLLLA